MEMAHRLFETPGKCQQIHGHSWWVELEIIGDVDEHGLLGSLDFGTVKKVLREYMDKHFDHHLLLNFDDDIVVAPVTKMLPGARFMKGDPTTENIAKLIGHDMRQHFGTGFQYIVTVWETSTNAATWQG
jgi:6-pyruvoyltetrahydropterin/6-carboxytetrahydropterin synthase